MSRFPLRKRRITTVFAVVYAGLSCVGDPGSGLAPCALAGARQTPRRGIAMQA